MKLRLQRILSILCILALFAGCLSFAVSEGEAEKVSRVIRVEWSDEDDYEGLRPDSVTMTIEGNTVAVTKACRGRRVVLRHGRGISRTLRQREGSDGRHLHPQAGEDRTGSHCLLVGRCGQRRPAA